MKYFLKRLSLFFIIWIALNIIFYVVIVKPAVYIKYLYNDNGINDYNVFLVADSRGAYLKNIPSKFNIFNFSYISDNYIDMYLKINYLIKKLNKNDTILLTVDNHTLSSYRENNPNLKLSIVYYEFTDLQKLDEFPKNFYFKKFTKYLPLLDFDYGRFYFIYLKRFHVIPKTSTFADLDISAKNKKCQRRYMRQFEGKTFSSMQKEYLLKIIALCKKNDITLIGIKFPVSEIYWDRIKNHDFYAAEILTDYNIQIIDLHDLFFKREEFFNDTDHLNLSGAIYLCEEINRRI